MSKNSLRNAVIAASLLLTACSETPAPPVAQTEVKKEPAIPEGPITGKTAFYEMYKPARAWSTDIQPLSLASKDVPGVKIVDGKAALWTAIFASPSKKQIHTYFYSTVDQGAHLQKGIRDGGTQNWIGPTTLSMPFQLSEFHVDSDAAYKAAAEKAGSWVQQHPDKTAALHLGNATRFVAPMWYIIWGTPAAGYAAYVSATTGSVLK